MASKAKKSVLDQLVDSGSSSASEGEHDGPQRKEKPSAPETATKGSGQESEEDEGGRADKRSKKGKGISLEDLQRAGYNSGPSVLLMRAPQEDSGQQWNWSDGRAAKQGEPEKESWQERQQTHYAATDGATEVGVLAIKAAEQAEKLRDARRMERQEQQQDRKMTFNQKEKRKRDEGKTSRAKNYVEEEKRIGRSLGMYSGFD